MCLSPPSRRSGAPGARELASWRCSFSAADGRCLPAGRHRPGGGGTELTYDEVGATLGQLPGGYRHGTYAVDLGMDARSFGRAVEALRQWRTHREAEIDLCPRCPAIEEGTVIGQLVRVGPLYAIACCRIVRVVNEEDRFGFAYGTLPAQPERGEEAFIVTHEAHRVRFEITAFSRPRHPLARLGGPVTRAVQDRVSQRYLNGVRNYLKEP